MQIVNGYVCQTCCDVAAAKRGKDPAHPDIDTTKPGQTDRSGQPLHPFSDAAKTPAVTFGGALARVDGAANAAGSSAAPSSTRYAGGLVDLSA